MSKAGRRCIALNGDGKQCPRESVVTKDYHGDSELYGYPQEVPHWVRAPFCKECSRYLPGCKELRKS